MKIKYSNAAISPDEIIKFISFTGQGDAIYKEAVKLKEARKMAHDLGLSPTDDDLQQFADNYRKMHGLITAEETYAFLVKRGLSEDDFEQYCEGTLLIERLKDHLADRDKIQEFFVNNRPDFDRARISVIVVKDQNLADEIYMQVVEEGGDFHTLARKHSIDISTKHAGGHVGLIKRKMLNQSTAAKVFNASPGEIIGPINCDGVYQLILVEDIQKAELTDYVFGEIRERIFEEWFSQIIKGGFEITE